MLDAVEDAPPVQAVEAATRGIAEALGATEVSLLIADVSGRALVRLTHVAGGSRVPGADGVRSVARERARELPLQEGPARAAMRDQTVQVLPPGRWADGCGGEDGRWTVLAPVIERGEALGRSSSVCPTSRRTTSTRRSRTRRTCSGSP